MSSESANHKVRFPNWLYHLSKLFSHLRYGPLKTNMHPKCYICYFIPILMIYESNIVWYFLMWMCLLVHFVLNDVSVPFENCKYYVSILYKVWVAKFWTW